VAKKTRKEKDLLGADISIGPVNFTQKVMLAKHLAITLRAGLTMREVLDIACDSAHGKLKKILRSVLRSVTAGQSLSSALGQYPRIFSGFFVGAVRTGEVSGTLVENLENIAEQLEKERQLIAKIKGATFYPVVILIATLVMGLCMAFFVLPKITPLFEGLGIELPLTTRALIWFSRFIEAYSFYFLGGLLSFVFFIIWLLKRTFMRPLTHWLVLNLPIIKKINRNAVLARFSRTMGMLVKSGVNIDEALIVTRGAVGNYYYEKALLEVESNISGGTALSKNLARFEHLFPSLLTRMIGVGEQTGRYKESFFYLADFYETEVDTATKSLATTIEPVLLLGIGAVVLFLALSIITPIYKITGGVRR